MNESLRTDNPRHATEGAMEGRPCSAKLLRDRARVMRTESIKLETLADQVQHLSLEADEALWKILISKQ